jgi:hypothetical protein
MMHLFTFTGIKPKEKWAVEHLDDVSRPLRPGELKRVSLVDTDELGAKTRAEAAGWMRLALVGDASLTNQENHASAIHARWGKLITAVHAATFCRIPGSDLRIQFLMRSQSYRGNHHPTIEIHTREDGSETLYLRGPSFAEKLDSVRFRLRSRGWSGIPLRPRQTGLGREFWAGTFRDALEQGLEAIEIVYPVSGRDFLKISGSSITHIQELSLLPMATHGSVNFYHLYAPESDEWAEDIAELRGTPPPAKADLKLSRADRERFIATHRKNHPDVHDWLDSEILYAMFHGM